jgi:methylmalonyl-CoA mutase C-terminal domain/subunit
MTIFPKVLQLMKEKGVDDVLLFGGGIIPDEDIKKLKEMGVGELYTPGANTQNIIKFLKDWVAEHPRN